MSGTTEPAWHPDPYGRHEYRYWNGTVWTEHVADNGVSGVDHVAADAAPTAAGAATAEPAAGTDPAVPASGDAATDPTTISPTPQTPSAAHETTIYGTAAAGAAAAAAAAGSTGDTPSVPEVPSTPETPSVPSSPVVPDSGVSAETPAVPGGFAPPETPQQPVAPQAPAQPVGDFQPPVQNPVPDPNFGAQATPPTPGYAPPTQQAAPTPQPAPYQDAGVGQVPPAYNPAPEAAAKKSKLLPLLGLGLLALLVLGGLGIGLTQCGGGSSGGSASFTEEKPFFTKTFKVKLGEAYRYRFLPSVADGEWNDDVRAIVVESVTEEDLSSAVEQSADNLEDALLSNAGIDIDDLDFDEPDEVVEQVYRLDEMRTVIDRNINTRDLSDSAEDELDDIEDERVTREPDLFSSEEPNAVTDGTVGGGFGDIGQADMTIRLTVFLEGSGVPTGDDELKGELTFETGDTLDVDSQRDFDDVFFSDDYDNDDVEDFLTGDLDWYTGE
jgi:hypothetical protein